MDIFINKKVVISRVHPRYSYKESLLVHTMDFKVKMFGWLQFNDDRAAERIWVKLLLFAPKICTVG